MVVAQFDQPKVLVIRHEACSSLGLLGQVLKQQDIAIRYLDTPAGEILDSLQDYSHLVILGGAISAYEEEQYPFLQQEFRLVETAIEQQLPVLGVCLGSQILAKVLGAKVYRGQAGREAGWCTVKLTETATSDPIFKDFPPQFNVFESHQDTFDLPSECVHLAFSSLYTNQAFRYQNHVWALQFHPEIDDQVLSDCAAVIAQELIDSKIEHTTVDQLIAEAREKAPLVAPLADTIMRNFLQISPRFYAQA